MMTNNISGKDSDQWYKRSIKYSKQERVDNQPVVRGGQRAQSRRNSHHQQCRLVKIHTIDPSEIRNMTKEESTK